MENALGNQYFFLLEMNSENNIEESYSNAIMANYEEFKNTAEPPRSVHSSG